MDHESTIMQVATILKEGGPGQKQKVTQLLVEKGYIQPEPEDPFRKIRNRAIEILDLDGQQTFVTVASILARVEDGWIPGLLALTEVEAKALDHVLRVWEHEVRVQLRHLLEQGERHDLPWSTVVEMSKEQEAYRKRLSLPPHPHGKCCTKYEEAHDDPILAATVHPAGS